MPKTIIRIPIRRANILTAKERLHWTQRHRKTSRLTNLGQTLHHKTGKPQYQTAEIHAHIQYPDQRRRDPANLHPTLKALIDGMVTGGLLPDDDYKHLDGPHIHHQPDSDRTATEKQAGMWIITIEIDGTPLPKKTTHNKKTND